MDKKKIIIAIVSAIVVFIVLGVIYLFNRQDKNSTLTIMEKQWIENNKNEVIDISIVNNVPIFNYDGEGLFFDFLNSIEKDTGLNFNKLSYNDGSTINSEYSFQIVDSLASNDILIYDDNYVLVTKNNVKYNNLNEIGTMTVGVLNNDLKDMGYYLGTNKNIAFKTYTSFQALFSAINTTNVNAIAVPKTMYLKEIVEDDNIYISYDISEMKKSFVLRLGSNKKLNRILKKYYKKWARKDYESSFNTNFSENYFKFKQVYEQEKANFRSKEYSYGFIENAPFDALVNGKLEGISNEIIKAFTEISDVKVSYKKYKNYEELLQAFNENKIDFYFNTSSLSEYSLDVYNTLSAYEAKAVVLSANGNDYIVNSAMSLGSYDVATIKNSKIDNYLSSIDVKTKTYDNIIDLIKNKKDKELIVIDKATYDSYMHKEFKKYNNICEFTIGSFYGYTARDITENKVFNEFLDFYLSYVNTQTYRNVLGNNMFSVKNGNTKLFVILLSILTVFAIVSTVLLIKKTKPKKKKVKNNISKEDKLKYVDMLTSLKNRNYLNDSIEKWDSSHVYPQAIVIVDLNNVAYINDNYGHEEGDNVINEAASILIQTQVEQTEIIRTNGNEFLIYMVGHDEKQVVSYTKKLNKELKELKHGFGAAVGYSMIVDELKTVDDAINEATLDMKSKKEEAQN